MRVDLRRISGTHGRCSSPRSSRCECSRTRIYPRRISRTHRSADRANNSRDWLRKRGNDQKHVLTLQLWARGLLYLEHWSPPKGLSQVLYLLACSCWDVNLGTYFHISVGELTPWLLQLAWKDLTSFSSRQTGWYTPGSGWEIWSHSVAGWDKSACTRHRCIPGFLL